MKTFLDKEIEFQWDDKAYVTEPEMPTRFKRFKNTVGRHWLSLSSLIIVGLIAYFFIIGNAIPVLNAYSAVNAMYGSVLVALAGANVFKYGFFRKRYLASGAENKIARKTKKLQKQVSKLENALEQSNNLQKRINFLLEDAKKLTDKNELKLILSKYIKLNKELEQANKIVLSNYKDVKSTNKKIVNTEDTFNKLILKINNGFALGKIFMRKYEVGKYETAVLNSNAITSTSQISMGLSFVQTYASIIEARKTFEDKNFSINKSLLNKMGNQSTKYNAYSLKDHANLLVDVNNSLNSSNLSYEKVYNKVSKQMQDYKDIINAYYESFTKDELKEKQPKLTKAEQKLQEQKEIMNETLKQKDDELKAQTELNEKLKQDLENERLERERLKKEAADKKKKEDEEKAAGEAGKGGVAPGSGEGVSDLDKDKIIKNLNQAQKKIDSVKKDLGAGKGK